MYQTSRHALLATVSTLSVGLTLTGCPANPITVDGSETGTSTSGNGDGDGDGDSEPATLLLRIPVPKAAVTIDGQVEYADNAGFLRVPDPGSSFVARVDAPGHSPSSVFMELANGLDAFREIDLLERPPPVPLMNGNDFATAEMGGTASMPGQAGRDVSVELMPNVLVDSFGEPVTGFVQVTLVHIDPTITDYSLLPAPFRGKTMGEDDDDVLMQSLGMVETRFWQDGELLDFANNAPVPRAIITLPVPESLEPGLMNQQPVPDWWLDLDSAHWFTEDPPGVLVESNGDFDWIAEIEQDGWHNADYIASYDEFACYVVVVRDTNDELVSRAWSSTATADGVYTDSGYSMGEDNVLSNCFEAPLGSVPVLDFPYATFTPPMLPIEQPGVCSPDGTPNLGCATIDVVVEAQEPACEIGVDIACDYSGDPNLLGIGACQQGHQYCINDGLERTQCQGEWPPQDQENCQTDYDDNCDGMVNEMCGGCGDGVAMGMEECDDGNADNTDGCVDGCVAAQCGDGFVWAGMEACDDGNGDDTDGCTTLCSVPACNDGLLSGDESDIDCGGSCPGCNAGQTCADVNDCDGGACVNFQCTGIATQVIAGLSHTCALLQGGAVRCWGWGLHGQLGYGNTNDIGDDEAPWQAGIIDVGEPVQQLTAGGFHTCALLDSGAVRCWGQANMGQLGYASTDKIGDDETPAMYGMDVSIIENVLELHAGIEHTCALLQGGAVRCWGRNDTGQLGYGDMNNIGDDESPAGDVMVGGAVEQLAVGGYHTCALLVGGTVRCWGRNELGQLGYGHMNNIGDDEPLAGDVAVGGMVQQLMAGRLHTCALLDTGAVRCWGANNHGQLGYGNTVTVGDDETPATYNMDVSIVEIVEDLGGGTYHSCALLQGGAIRCWGQAGWGQLGYGNINDIGDDEAPVGNVDVGDIVMQLTVGQDHACGLLSGGRIRCWGLGASGQLGHGNTDSIGDDEAPVSVGDVPYN